MICLSKPAQKWVVWTLFAAAIAAEASTFYFTAARGYPMFAPSGSLGAQSGLVIGGVAMMLYLRNPNFAGVVISLFAGVLVSALGVVPPALLAIADASVHEILPGLLLGFVRGFGFSVVFLSSICWVLSVYDRRDRSKES